MKKEEFENIIREAGVAYQPSSELQTRRNGKVGNIKKNTSQIV